MRDRWGGGECWPRGGGGGWRGGDAGGVRGEHALSTTHVTHDMSHLLHPCCLNHAAAAAASRAGMDIPHGTISNASLWGARVWVPAALLAAAAAAGGPTPDLMYHLRTTLNDILNEPEGILNKQVRMV